MARVVRKDGFLISTVRNGNNPYIKGTGRDPLPVSRLRELHKSHGLELVRTGVFKMPSPWPGAKGAFFNTLQSIPVSMFKAGRWFISKPKA